MGRPSSLEQELFELKHRTSDRAGVAAAVTAVGIQRGPCTLHRLGTRSTACEGTRGVVSGEVVLVPVVIDQDDPLIRMALANLLPGESFAGVHLRTDP